MRESIIVPARLIQAAGEALHGGEWQAPLARDLNVNIRTTQRWAAAARADEPYQMSRGLMSAILGLLERKVQLVTRPFDALKELYDR